MGTPAGIFKLEGAAEAGFAVNFALDGRSRKNEAKRLGFGREVYGGIVVIALGLGEFDEQAGFLFRFYDGGFALGLESTKLGCVLFEAATDALFVEGEELEILSLSDPGLALGERGVEFGSGGIGPAVLPMAESEDGIFEGAGSMEAPFVLGDGLREIELQRADGGESLDDGVTVLLEGLLVFRGEDDELASEAVAEGVQARTSFTFGGTGAG